MTNSLRERRPSHRSASDLRPTQFRADIQRNAAGSVLISTGRTEVICSASVEERVPNWMRDSGKGWVTAEYAMLPGSGSDRISRRVNARATEIKRLIGRSLRAAVDLEALDGFTITLDCDVLNADGGTRTASVTGAWVALCLAGDKLVASGKLARSPVISQVAAVSVGMVGGTALLDLDYIEDSDADVDMNVVGLADGRLIEVQGTAEGAPFDRRSLDELLDLAQKGIATLAAAQLSVVPDMAGHLKACATDTP